ncbi:MAG: right-handed parallel beta-helix repeat-containing protein [SAR324 cluster bacterium]|nr:right-handed parallel beta-helix repeat-containing protein [SAR324 cluster bacterium]
MKTLPSKFQNRLFVKVAIFIFFIGFIATAVVVKSSEGNLKESIRSKIPELYKTIKMRVVYPIFKQQVIGASSRGDIPQLKLVLSRKDIAHFTELYRRYESKKGQSYYTQNNRWQKARLFYKGTEFKIKIKAHGKSPTDHRAGKYISFSIKLKGKTQINNVSRFSLLIHDRLSPRTPLVEDMASRFNLLRQKRDLVNLKINNWDDKLYYIEYKLNSKFMEAQGNSSLKLFSSDISAVQSDKSMIIASRSQMEEDFDPFFYSQLLKEALDAEGFTGKNGEMILQRYRNLNKAIASGNTQLIKSFFDDDYITSFNAARLLLGHIGHGSVRGNLYVFFNLANGKFYPAITRDHIPDYLTSDGTLENKVNSWVLPWNTAKTIKLPLFHLLSQNERLRQMTYQKIFAFIQKEGDHLPQIHQKLILDQQKVYYLGWVKEFLRLVGIGKYKDITKTNFDILSKYLLEAKPEVEIAAQGNRLFMSFKPQAMAELKITSLKIQLPLQFASSQIKINQHSWVASKNQKDHANWSQVTLSVDQSGQVDVSPAMAKLTFFDGLDFNSYIAPRTYQILLEAKQNSFDWGSHLEQAQFAALNQVTGQKISNKQIKVTAKLKAKIPSIPPVVLALQQTTPASWARAFPNARLEAGKILIPKGSYYVQEDLIFPEGSHVTLAAGAKILIAEDRGVLIQGSLTVEGTKQEPVIITAKKQGEAFGSFAILGTGKEASRINHLILSGGNEKWMNGAYFSGAFSLHYQKSVQIENSQFIGGRADDGVNIKFSKIFLKNNIFKNNFADQIDLDYCNGFVLDSSFLYEQEGDNNGDGLDISGSQIYASGNLYKNFNDKGISVGEKSNIFIINNRFESNRLGSAVKDLSNAYYLNNKYSKNLKDIQAYQKKKIFGGGNVFLDPKVATNIRMRLDKKSKGNFFPQDIQTTAPWLLTPPESLTNFFTQLEEIQFHD